MSLSWFIIFIQIYLTLCEKRRFIFEMFRHGARAPWSSLDDKNVDLYGTQWSGDSELTEVGMRQHYLLGYKNRKNFKDFISEKYDLNEIYVISTDTNRTIMSAYSQLQGLYPAGLEGQMTDAQTKKALPPTKDDFTDKIKELGSSPIQSNVQVIPIHIFDPNDKSFNIHGGVCKGAAPLIEENKKDPELIKFINDEIRPKYGEKLLKILKKESEGSKYFDDYFNVYRIMDCYVSNYFDDKPLKGFEDQQINKDEFLEVSLDFLHMDQYIVNFGDKDSYIAKYAMSPTFKNILYWIDTRIANDKAGKEAVYSGFDEAKLIMYSGHDTNMANLMKFLKVMFPENKIDLIRTTFASNFFIELFGPDKIDSTVTDKDYNVVLTFNDNLLFKMNYADFKDNLNKKLIPMEEINKFCGWEAIMPDPKPKPDPVIKDNTDTYMIATIILGVVIVILIGYIIFTCYKKKKDPSAELLNNNWKV